MDEALLGVFIVVALAIGGFVGYQMSHTENYKISCLELNLGKENCDKIFNKKEK